MDNDSEFVLAVGSIIVSIIGAIFTGIKFSRCTKIQCGCCSLEREIVNDSKV